MRKQLFFSTLLVVAAFCSTSFSLPGIAPPPKPVTSCTRSVTFYNSHSTYTIPLVMLSDGSALPGSTDSQANVAPGTSTVLSVTWTSGGLEFNVQIDSPNPKGRVRLLKNGVQIACTNITANQNIVTLQMDNSVNCLQNDVYTLYFEPGIC